MCDHGFIGACAECDGCGQTPEADTMGEVCIMAGCERPVADGEVYCRRHADAPITAEEFYGDEA